MSHQLAAFLVVFVGGGLGSALRHAVNQASAAIFGVTLAWGTLFVNITGSLLMGLLAGWLAYRGESGPLMRLFLTTGILGGFTTFSAFSLDTLLLWERGQPSMAALYAAVSVVAAVFGVFAGLSAMRIWFS
jgi:CrcB protein